MKKKSKEVKFMSVCGHYVLVKPHLFEMEIEHGALAGFKTASDRQGKREDASSVRGTLVGVGSQAWKAFADGEPWAKLGDEVFFKRHVSDRIYDKEDEKDKDREEYFLMQDENILAVINRG